MMTMELLVGSTGFVGGNLRAAHDFSAGCHSSDIADFYGSTPDLCIYAGVPAAMYLANQNPDADLAVMRQARENIRRIAPRRLVLISSIAVYADSRGKTETDEPETDNPAAYGRNRLQLEYWVREDFPESLIVRLPALYGRGLKKNFLFDMLTITPAMLREEMYALLAEKSTLVRESYEASGNGFFKLRRDADKENLRLFFETNDFNALSFTDSRSRFQFYPLQRLWGDIATALQHGLTMLHLSPPPVSAAEVYQAYTGKDGWCNHLAKEPFDYDLRSVHAELLGGHAGYLCSKEEEMADICRFLCHRGEKE